MIIISLVKPGLENSKLLSIKKYVTSVEGFAPLSLKKLLFPFNEMGVLLWLWILFSSVEITETKIDLVLKRLLQTCSCEIK